MNAKYGDMLEAIKAHDKGLYRYARYSGESVKVLEASIAARARGDIVLIAQANEYMRNNFIEVRVKDKLFKPAKTNDVFFSNEQPKPPQEKVNHLCASRCRPYIQYMNNHMFMPIKNIGRILGVSMNTVWNIYFDKQSRVTEKNVHKFEQWAAQAGVTLADCEPYNYIRAQIRNPKKG